MIFGTIVDDTNKANKQITIFGSKVSDIKTNLNTIDGKGLNKVSAGIKAIGVQAVWTEIKVAALNMALSMGVSLAVSALATAIGNWAHESERAAEEAEELKKRQAELRTEGLQNAEIYEKESDELNSILSQYLQLASSSSNVADIKKELSSLQDQLIDKYGEEANGIDLVNNSLEKNIELITEKQRLDAKEWQRNNSEQIQAAKDYFGVKDLNDVPKGRTQSLIIDAGDARSEAIAEGEKLVDAALEYIKEKYPEIVDDIYLQVTQGMNDDVGLSNFIGGASIEEQKREIDAVAEAYEYALGKYSDTIEYFGNLSRLYSDREEFSEAYNFIRKIQDLQDEERDWGKFEKDKETFGEYKKLLKQLNQLNTQYNDSSLSVAERYGASLELADTVDQLKAIAIQYPVTSETIETALQNIGLSYSDTSATVESAKEVWLKSLDEAQKGVLSDVDKMIAAMKKLTSGEAIDSKSAWEIINLDDTGILSDIRLDSNGDYILDIEQIIKLKDIEIQKEIDLRKESIETAKRQKEEIEDRITLRKQLINDLIASGINSGGDQRRLNELRTALESDESAMESLNYTIRNESMYVDELTSKMGNLSNSGEMLEAQIKAMQKEVSKLKDEVSKLNTEAEARLKAQEHAVDEIIDKLQDEVDEMEKGKTELEDQLKILEEQKESLEEIVSNYKTASDVVDNTISKQIEEIEENRKQVEDYYNSLIDKLKQENDEREDALELQQKLANLENAKNNKVRTYDKERGWTYAADKEAIQKAQNELDEVKKNQEIKALETERDAKLKEYDDQIDGFEQYAKEWKAVVEDIENAENERIAEEILGSDWREKIKSKDTDILGKYKTNYASYTTHLKTLTNNEIKYLNDSIKAKEKEIETKKKQIQVWKDYKTEISNAAKEVKDKLEEYNKYLNEVEISENSTNDARVQNLETFKTKYSNLIDEISKKNSQIENTEKQITSLTDAMNKLNETSNSATTSSTPVMGGIANGVTGALTGSGVFEAIISALQEAFNKLKTSIPHFAKGGSAGFTGLAWMDGTPNSTETVFTAAQSKKLYDYVNNMPEFSQLFSMNPSLLKGKTTNNSSSVSIGQMTVVANNPQEFATQFKQQMSTYLRTKLTESQIY